MEMTFKEPNGKYDFSLQDNLLHPQPKEEALDFRVEIERRFQRSIPNKVYVFPKNLDEQPPNTQADDEEISSANSSMDELKHVTIYDLAS